MDELKQKINASIAEHRFVGEVVFTEQEVSAMLERAHSLLWKYWCGSIYNIARENDEFMFVLLVQLAKKWRDDDDDGLEEKSPFWDYIYRQLGFENNQKIYGYFQSMIWRLKDRIIVAENAKWYYGTIMLHAFAPKSSMFQFFELCYNVFKKDLDFNYTQGDKDVAFLAADRLRSVFEQSKAKEGESISIGSNAYTIRIGIKSLATSTADVKGMSDLLHTTLLKINDIFHSDGKCTEEDYLTELLCEWWQKRDSRDDPPPKVRVKAVDKKNIIVTYSLDEGRVLLQIPPIRLDSSHSPWLAVYVGDSTTPIISEEIFIKETELIATSKLRRIPLHQIFGKREQIKLKVEISIRGEVIYDSKNTLNREFILFGEKREETKQVLKADNYFLFSTDIDGFLHRPDNISACGNNVFEIYPQEGDMLSFGFKQVFFRNVDDLSIVDKTFWLAGQIKDIEYQFGGDSYNIFNQFPLLTFSKKVKTNGLELRINGVKTLFERLKYQAQEGEVIIDLSRQLESRQPIILEIYSHENEKVAFSQNIIVFQGLQVKFDKDWHYGDSEHNATIVYNGNDTDFCFTHEDDTLELSFESGTLIIVPHFLKWKIDGGTWNKKPQKKLIWYKALVNGSLLQLSIPLRCRDIKFYALASGQLIELQVEKDQVKIGEIVYSNIDQDEITVFGAVGNVQCELFHIARKEKFLQSPISYGDDALCWDAREMFVGESQSRFDLELSNYSPIVDLDVESKKRFKINEGVYQYRVIKKGGNIFNKTSIVLFEGEIIIGKSEKFRFAGKKLRLKNANCGIPVDGKENMWESFGANNYGIDNLKYIEDDEGVFYTGSLFFISHYGERRYLNSMKNENGAFDKINPVRLEMRSNNTCWLAAGYTSDGDILGDLIFDVQRSQLSNHNPRSKIEKQNFLFVNLLKFEVENDVKAK